MHDNVFRGRIFDWHFCIENNFVRKVICSEKIVSKFLYFVKKSVISFLFGQLMPTEYIRTNNQGHNFWKISFIILLCRKC